MLDGADLRRAEMFLRDLENTSALPLTDTDANFLSLPDRKKPQSNTPQETHSAPPPASSQPTNLTDLPRLA